MDYKFLHNKISNLWTILAPRRQSRPNIVRGTEPLACPFCVGQESSEEELYRVDSPWLVRVLPNKFPFTDNHEIIVHSPDHHKNIDELPLSQVEIILQTFNFRFLAHQNKGKVYIFHNHGIEGGESLSHPHTQLTVIPKEVTSQIPPLEPLPDNHFETDYFNIFCPSASQWPDEVWIAPKRNGESFGGIAAEEIADLSLVLQRVIQLLDIRHGSEFPFNFYISPENDWYVRVIPRLKRLGGFEVGTNIFVNTQDPSETIAFIKAHFENPDVEKMQSELRAEYSIAV